MNPLKIINLIALPSAVFVLGWRLLRLNNKQDTPKQENLPNKN